MKPTDYPSIQRFRDFVALEYRRDGLPRVAIAKVPANGLPAGATVDDTLHELVFDEELFSAGVGANRVSISVSSTHCGEIPSRSIRSRAFGAEDIACSRRV